MAFTQEQVNNWFAANPGATKEYVAETVKGLGGLDANPGLAGLIGQHYNTDAAGVTNAYNTLVPPPAQSTTNTATTGAANFSAYTPDSMGIATTTPPVVTPPVVAPTFSPVQANVDKWKADNPTGTPQQIANAIAAAGGMTPDIAQAVANAYGTNVDEVNAAYGRLDPYAQMAQSYTNKDYSGINSLLGSSGLTSSQVQQHFGLTDEQMNQARDLGVNLNYTTPEIQRLVESSLSDKTLSPTLQINKILETGQKYGFGEAELEKLYGKDKVAAALDTYKTGLNEYLTNTLATDPTQTTMNEVGEIHRAAQKYGVTPEELVKYGGLDPETAQSYFDMYERGLGTIVANALKTKDDPVGFTKTLMGLQQKYGSTDAELAKASGYSEKDVKEYLDPVRNVPVNLQKLFEDENATAKDIQKFIADAKLDPRAAEIYGAALDNLTNNPELYLRVAASGKPDMAGSYDSFLKAAKATPELAAKYAPQIKAIEQVNSITNRAVYKDNGGVRSDWMYEMFMGLNPKETSTVPKQLEFTEQHTPINKGIEPVYEDIYDDSGPYSNLTGYRVKVDSDVFKEHPYNALYATYDANGKLTGYESNRQIYTGDRTYYGAKWNADGSAAPYGVQKSRGGLGGFVDSIASMGPIGTLALMAATGGLGSLAAGALANTAVGAALGTIGTNAVASGLVSGALSDMSGGDFGKGFVGGAVGSGVGSLAQGAMPNGGLTTTGVPMVDSYLTQAIPKAAGSMASTGVLGGDMGDAGLYSLLNTGVNMGTNSLLQNSGIGTLPTSVQPYATGVASNVISSALTGKDPDLEKAITKTMMQQAMQTGKSAVKTAAKP